MTIIETSAKKIFLRPGEIFIGRQPAVVTTVLGSCISVTLHCPALEIGGICHAILPSGSAKESGKYVDQSILRLLDCFRILHVPAAGIVAKLFGGSEMFTTPQATASGVGAANIRTARRTLAEAGLVPVAIDVGGTYTRKLIFYSSTGEVFLKRTPTARQLQSRPGPGTGPGSRGHSPGGQPK